MHLVVKRLPLILGLLLCSGIVDARPPDDDNSITRLGRFRGGAAPVANNITIVDKGTTTCFEEFAPLSVCTTPGITISNGAAIVVFVVADGTAAVGSISWGANVFGVAANSAIDRSDASGFSRAAIGSMRNVTGATAAVTVTMAAPFSPVASIIIGVAQINGISGVDGTMGAFGSGDHPIVGITNTIVNQILVAVVGNNNGAVGGTWQNGFTALQSADTGISGGNCGLSVGYRLVTATGSYTADKTGATTVDWVICATGYYQ